MDLTRDSKSLPPSGWDAEPVIGIEVIIEALTDIICDLMYDSGWMEIKREEVDRVAMVSVTV